MWLTEDGGRTWRRGNQGLNPGYLPEEALQAENAGRCVHHVERAPRQPGRMFMQFHGGVYRSDDAGESWIDVGGGGLPSDFGFPLMVDPADPDSAYLIPLVADVDRVTPDGRVRVYETRDAGSTWTARENGLPAEHARLPHGPAPGIQPRRRRQATRAVLWRYIRLERRRIDLVQRRYTPAAGVLRRRHVAVNGRATARSRSRKPASDQHRPLAQRATASLTSPGRLSSHAGQNVLVGGHGEPGGRVAEAFTDDFEGQTPDDHTSPASP